jgi:predicted permease
MPDWRPLVRRKLAALRLQGAAENALVDEIAQHLEDTYREVRGGGSTHEDAWNAALEELEQPEALSGSIPRNQRMPKHDNVPAGDPGPRNWMSGIGRDIRYGVRSMRRSPLFVFFSVMTLALGIGANTTMFTVINTLLLKPLPVPDSSGLVAVTAVEGDALSRSSAPLPLSYPEFRDYQQRQKTLSSLAAYSFNQMLTIQQGGGADRIFSEFVTHNYFATLGLSPVLGRFFRPDEEEGAGDHPVAVLNYGTWQTKFGGRADIVGSTIRLNGLPVTIVGVAPKRFIGVNAIFGPEIWLPASMTEPLMPNTMGRALSDRSKALFKAVGRLAPGIARSRVQSDLSAIASSLAGEFPQTNRGRAAELRPLRDVLFPNGASMAMAGAILAGVVGVVLLIACSNVANLMLARSASRRQEMAVRMAMGASRPRLVRQLLTESVLLATLGGALGLGFSVGGIQFLFGRLPAAATFATPRMDADVAVFALLVSLVTGLLFGIMPALKISRAHVAETLKEESRTAGRSRGRVRVADALVIGQVAFSFLLLVIAALFLRSIGRAYQLDPGFQTAHLATFMTNPGQSGYSRARTTAFYKTVRDRVATLPGVAAVSWSSNLPLWASPRGGVEIEGRVRRSATDTLRAIVTVIDVDYFTAAGVTVLRGREFTAEDRDNTEPVAIVNEKVERDYWPGGAIGRRIQLPGEEKARRIVAVAKVANYSLWGEAPQLCVYVPLSQSYSDAMTLFVRTVRDPREVLAPVAREFRAAAPEVVVTAARTGAELVDGGLFQAKVAVALLVIFGVLALGLASIGLYGILAYSVTQRRREIGLRMALGASRSTVLSLVLKQGMRLVAGGLLVGSLAAMGVGRMLSGMLFGVGATDPVSLSGAAAVLLTIALFACGVPALLASRVDPIRALRES